MVTKEQETINRLEQLGLKSAANKVKELSEKKRKMMIAYEHYRFVREEKIDAFNDALKVKTRQNYTYQQLSFTPVDQYDDVPPTEVLDDLQIAMDRKCFDSFEVAHIITVTKVPDPILFGRIVGCTDRFFIGQWDDDVKIEDILSPNEG